MGNTLTASQIDNIIGALSATRLATFHGAAGFSANTHPIDKYSWHALMSAAFFASLHVCEVTVRNAVDSALCSTYGKDWPWNRNFERSLPNPKGPHFQPQSELMRARGKMQSGATGKVIAELRFAFWCHLFTVRYQGRIWDSQILHCFPNFPHPVRPAQARQVIHAELERYWSACAGSATVSLITSRFWPIRWHICSRASSRCCIGVAPISLVGTRSGKRSLAICSASRERGSRCDAMRLSVSFAR